MTAPAASSQLGWLLKHLDALTDSELRALHHEVDRRVGERGVYKSDLTRAYEARQRALKSELRGSASVA